MKVEEIKLAFETNVQLAGVNDIFNAVKKAKGTVNTSAGAIREALSRLGNSKNEYSAAKTIADKFLNDLRSLDPELINSEQGKKAQRFLDTIDSDMKIVNDLNSELTRMNNIAGKFVI